MCPEHALVVADVAVVVGHPDLDAYWMACLMALYWLRLSDIF